MLQVNQERLLTEYSLSRAEVQVGRMEKLMAQQNQSKEYELNAMREEIASLNKVIAISTSTFNPSRFLCVLVTMNQDRSLC